MNQFCGQLQTLLHDGNKIAFLGVGSPLRADDSIGLYIVTELEKRLQSGPERQYRFFLGESAPENFSGEIRGQSPSHLVLFDAAEMDAAPGTFRLIPPEQITSTSFSTHTLPLKILADYLVKTTGCRIVIVGIQPKLLEFAYEATPEVIKAADEFVAEFCKMMG